MMDPLQNLPDWLIRTMELVEIIRIEDVKLSEKWEDSF